MTDPNHQTEMQAKLEQGWALHQQGQWVQARECYQQVLALNPQHFDALHLLGVIACQTHDFAQAVDLMNKAIAIYSTEACAYSNRGVALAQLKQHQAALEDFNQAIALQPTDAQAHYNRGKALADLKQYRAALESYDRAIALNPSYVDAYNSRINALWNLGLHQEALASCNQIIRRWPEHSQAYANRGNILGNLQQYQAALENYDQAITLNPGCARLYNERGVMLWNLKQYQAAMHSHDQALALKADDAETHFNRGTVLRYLGQLLQAADSYGKAIALKPDYAEAHWNQGLCYLQRGHFELGWEKYEWRHRTQAFKAALRHVSKPLWLGEEPLQGKTILLYSEQGLGDTLQFCRYAKQVHELGAHVLLEIQQPLVELLSKLEGVQQVFAVADALPAFDYHCPLISLPRAFRTTLETIPTCSGYITSSADKVAYWKAKLDQKTRPNLGSHLKPRIGLAWSGNTAHTNDHNRSFALAELLKWLPTDFEYVSLQKEIRPLDQPILQACPHIADFSEQLQDFTDTAALCELMDLVISIDTSVAHLAGAIGKPVWVLLPANADWRWLLDRDDSPWYPTAKLYRQEKMGEWAGVFERVAADLSKHLLSQSFEALHALGLSAYQAHDFVGAVNWMDQAIELNSQNDAAYNDKGIALWQLKRHKEAIISFDQALALAPNNARVHNNRANALRDLGRYADALESYEHAIALQTDLVQAYYNRGVTLGELNFHQGALADFDRVIALQPDFAQAHYSRGVCLKELGQHQAAVDSYNRSIALEANYVPAYYDRGFSLETLGQYQAALADYDKVIAMDATHGDAHWNQGLCRLRRGEFERGWEQYKWRWKSKQQVKRRVLRHFVQPQWSAAYTYDPSHHLLIWGEQGPGDQILFLSMLDDIATRVQKITVAVEPRLMTLVQRSFPQVQVVALSAELEQAPVDSFDSQIPMGELGQFVRTCWEDFPLARRSYLVADPVRCAQFRADLPSQKPLVCGISWFSRNAERGPAKSIRLQDLKPVLTLNDFQWVDLQYSDTRAERMALQEELSIEVVHVDEVDNFKDIDGLAALIDACDVVVTVSNTTAHIAGALGKSVYLMLPYADGLLWYWHEGRDDSPWYPAVKLYRQQSPGDWAGVIERVAVDLRGRGLSHQPCRSN